MFRIRGALTLLAAGVVVGWAACDNAQAEVKVQHAVLEQKPGQPLKVQPVQYGWGVGAYSTPYYYSYYGPYSYPYMTYYNYGPYYASSAPGVNPYSWPVGLGYRRWGGWGGNYYGPGGGAILGAGGVGYGGYGYGAGYGGSYGYGGAGCNCR